MKNNQKKIVTTILAMAMLFAIGDFTQNVAKANNWKDTKFDFYYSGSGSDVSSKARTKMDNSMSYVNSSSKSGGVLRVTGEAKKGIVNGQWGDVLSKS